MALKKGKKEDLRPIIKKFEIVQHAEEGGEGNWLVSYADMMTLLCGFFIMMFSMATLDTPKYDALKESIAKQFGGEYTSPTKELAKYATNVIQELGVEKEAVIASDPSGVSVTFESTLFFGSLSSDVTPAGKTILDKLITAVAARQSETGKVYRIVVEGHTDGRPVVSGAFASNWELSGSRAARVIRLFLEKGYAPDRLTAIGYADTRPIVAERKADGTWDEAALAKNRRVVLRVLEPNVDSIPYPEKGAAPMGPPAPATSEATAPAAAAPAAVSVKPAVPASAPHGTPPSPPSPSLGHHRG